MKLEIGKLKIGELYTCPKHHVFLFPTDEKASACEAATTTLGAAMSADRYTAWWSKELKCHVGWIPAGVPWMVVELRRIKARGYHQVRVLAGQQMGWINVANWIKIKELTRNSK